MKPKPPTSKADPELARWCEVLSAGATVAEVVPPGWKTIKTLAAARQRGECSTLSLINRLIEVGRVEKKVFRIRLATTTRPVPHYKLK